MNKLAFASLQVRDLEVSKAFYITKLGFEDAGIPNPDACVFRYSKGEVSFAIRTPMSNLDGKELGAGVSLWFAIDGTIEDLEADFSAKHVPLQGSVRETPFGKILVATDPDGYSITFLQPNA